MDSSKELKMYRNGNSVNSFLYVDNGKIFEELFTPTLNEIAVSFWYVSSTPVLHAVLSDHLRYG